MIRRVYLFKDGTFQECNFGRNTPAKYDFGLNSIRDKRKLMLEITRRGDVYLYFKDNVITLTNEQVEAIKRLMKPE